MQVISPVGELEQELLTRQVLGTTLDGKTLGVIQLVGASSVFTERIVERLRADYDLADVIWFVKDVDMAPSPAAVLEDLERRADLVLSSYGH